VPHEAARLLHQACLGVTVGLFRQCLTGATVTVYGVRQADVDAHLRRAGPLQGWVLRENLRCLGLSPRVRRPRRESRARRLAGWRGVISEWRAALQALTEALPEGAVVPVPREWLLELLAGSSEAPWPGPSLGADLTVADLARRFGRARSTIRQWLEQGAFVGAYHFRGGREWRVPPASQPAADHPAVPVLHHRARGDGHRLAEDAGPSR
jgi:hypothetical protein